MPKLSSLYLAVLAALAPAAGFADNKPASPPANAQSTDLLDEITVTATRSARGTKTVPAAVASIGQEKLNKLRMNSISDALQSIPGVLTYSKNGLGDAKLVIRGAGLKATYGVREIMVLRDGIPMTEPDSFTRLDSIDGQDIDRLEVTKGPGGLYASGSSGGTVHIITKSVFDQGDDRIKVGAGNNGDKNYHLRIGGDVSDNQAMSLTATHREVPNDWRYRNNMSSDHVSVKHGLRFGENNKLETEIGYSKIDLQLAGSMDDALWNTFKTTGQQTGVSGAIKHAGRYSENFSANTRAEIDMGSYTLKPKVYYTQYHHYHPVSGIINDNSENPPTMLGADLEAEKKHQLAGKEAKAVFGVAVRQDEVKDAKKYQFADLIAGAGGRTLSDREGALAEVDSSKNTLTGVFGSENIKLTDKLSLDASARADNVKMTSDINQISKYNYGTNSYGAGAGISHRNDTMTLSSANVGLSYALTNKVNAFATVAKADQIPASSELDNNPNLNKASNRNVEVGLKGRSGKWSFDTSVYDIEGKNEVVNLRQANGLNQYVNAGKTSKKGFELAGSYAATDRVDVGGGYAYNNYKYKNFQEPVGATNIDRSGNSLPTIPKTQLNVFAEYKHPNGFSARVQARKDGSYFLDNANTEKWTDNPIITGLNVAYTQKKHKVDMTVDNLLDKRYAVEVSKDTTGKRSYSAGSPRAVMVNYTYQF